MSTSPIDEWDLVEVRWSATDIGGGPVRGYLIAKANIERATFTNANQRMVLVREQRFPISNGEATLLLRATDDPDVSITGFTYTITEYIGNVRGVSYDITVPLSAVETGIDISDVIAPLPSPGYSPGYPVTQQQLLNHVNDPMPHPVYDDIPSLTLIFENRLV